MPSDQQLIVRIFGTDVDPDVSAAYRDQIEAWQDNHAETLANFIDSLAVDTGSSIDDLYLSVRRGMGSTEQRGLRALQIIAWHTLALPYKPENAHYLASRCLLDAVEQHATALYTFATLVVQVPNVGSYIKLLKLDPELAQQYFTYAVQFYYTNPGHESEHNAMLAYADQN